MPDRADRADRTDCAGPADPETVAPGWVRQHRPTEQSLFSGVYGLVLASALASALDATGEKAEPGADALWVVLTALAASAAHGYAHVIARRASADTSAPPSRWRLVLAEWPLFAASLPTVAMLLAAAAGWWAESTAVDWALLFNTAALFCWGAWSARTSGHSWPSSFRAGVMDMLIGCLIIIANAVIH